MPHQYAVGDRVIRNPASWRASEFDAWGAGVGVGIVVEVYTKADPDVCDVDVRWPAGRCWQWSGELLHAPP